MPWVDDELLLLLRLLLYSDRQTDISLLKDLSLRISRTMEKLENLFQKAGRQALEVLNRRLSKYRNDAKFLKVGKEYSLKV